MVMNVYMVQIPRTARVVGTVTSQYRACDGEVEAIPGVAKRVVCGVISLKASYIF
jgi:hypothetical protein